MMNENNVYYLEYRPPYLEDGDSIILRFRSLKSLSKHIKDFKIKKEEIISLSNSPIKKTQNVSGTVLRSLFEYISEINYR
jgi:hypothetical protein